MEYTLQYGKGYSGKKSAKCWVAAITGLDNQYGLKRDFVEPVKVEREHFNRPRTMITFHWELADGLYEVSESGDRWFMLVHEQGGKQVRRVIDDQRVKAIAELLDSSVSFREARIRTMPAKQQAS